MIKFQDSMTKLIKKTNNIAKSLFQEGYIVHFFTLIAMCIWGYLLWKTPLGPDFNSIQLKWGITHVTSFMSILFGYVFYWMQTYTPDGENTQFDKTSIAIFGATALWTVGMLLSNSIAFLKGTSLGEVIKQLINCGYNKERFLAVISALNSMCFLIVMKSLSVYRIKIPFQERLKKHWYKIVAYAWIIVWILLFFPHKVLPIELQQINIWALIDFIGLGILTIRSFLILVPVAKDRHFPKLVPIILSAIVLTGIQQWIAFEKPKAIYWLFVFSSYKCLLWIALIILLNTSIVFNAVKGLNLGIFGKFKLKIGISGNFHNNNSLLVGYEALIDFLRIILPQTTMITQEDLLNRITNKLNQRNTTEGQAITIYSDINNVQKLDEITISSITITVITKNKDSNPFIETNINPIGDLCKIITFIRHPQLNDKGEINQFFIVDLLKNFQKEVVSFSTIYVIAVAAFASGEEDYDNTIRNAVTLGERNFLYETLEGHRNYWELCENLYRLFCALNHSDRDGRIKKIVQSVDSNKLIFTFTEINCQKLKNTIKTLSTANIYRHDVSRLLVQLKKQFTQTETTTGERLPVPKYRLDYFLDEQLNRLTLVFNF
jgi:hypothetical protein